MRHLYKCIIFDFDGTLADTHEGIVKTYRETIRLIGLPVPSVEKVTSTIGLELKDGLKAGVDGMTEEQAVEACAVYRKIFPRIAMPCIKAFDGAVDMLKALHAEGYCLAIATSRSHRSLEPLVCQLGMEGLFEGLYGAEDVVNHKPAPDLVLRILEDFCLKPDEVLVIGDATYDLLMGKRAGCKVCGVTWGNQSAEQLGTAEPDHIVSTFNEIYQII